MSDVDRTLRAFEERLRGPRRARRRLLEEVASHLRDSLDAEVALGAAPADAERAVLDRFGDPDEAVALWNTDHAERRRASRRNALLLAVTVVAAAALGLAQHASGKSAPQRPAPRHSARLHHQ